MHVFIHGIHILTLIDPVEQDGEIVARYKVVHKNRLAQKIGYIRRGEIVYVLAGGRKGFIDAEPTSERITIRLV